MASGKRLFSSTCIATLLCLSTLFLMPEAFVCRHGITQRDKPEARATSSSLAMIDPSSMARFGDSLWLATIDADIANIPTNEFRTVFMGGLAVMAGGLLSAVAVGAILEASDGYAAVVAESYDMEADEEFWKGLSDEEAKKAREMLARVKAQRGESIESVDTTAQVKEDIPRNDQSTVSRTEVSPEKSSAEVEKKIDMFSDY